MNMIFQFLGIQIFTIFYLLLIITVYMSKKRYQSAENNLFLTLLIFNFILIILDIIGNFSIRNTVLNNSPNLFNNIICHLNMVGYQVWSAILTTYVLILGSKKDYVKIKDLFKNKMILIFSITSLILVTLTFVFPIEYIYNSNYNISYMAGSCTTYSYAVVALYFVISFSTIIINKNKVSITKRLPIFIFLVLAAILLILQRSYEDVPVLIVPLMSFIVMVIYFTLENPDLKMVSELNKLANEANEASKVSNKFLNNISDNIKEPINLIVGYSESLLLNDTDKSILDDAKNINIESTNLLDMLNNTINMSKLETDSFQLNNYDYNLKDLLSNIYDKVINTYVNDKIKFAMNITPNTPVMLNGDSEKIKIILINLLSNAFKYTDYGKVIFNINGNIINDKVLLTFKITDTGSGIKEENYNKIFEKFAKIEDNKINKGTGLGLTIALKLANLMNGTIKIASNYGAGSTFIVEILQNVNSNETINNFDVVSYNQEIYNINANMLIVSDIIKDTTLLQKMLRKYSLNISVVTTFKELDELLKINKNFDLILIRHEMKNPNGDNMINYLSKINLNSKLIGMSYNNDLANNYESFNYDYYLLKPFRLNSINKLLKKFIQK